MRTAHRRPLLALVLIVPLLVLGLGAPGSSAAQPTSSLSIAEGIYVGGQSVTFEGNLGIPGEREIGVQFHMGRPGDDWTDIDWFSARTDEAGNFSFRYPAPAMFNIGYRVIGGGAATPQTIFNARSQDLVLRALSNAHKTLPDNQVVAGQPFTIEVDTTPSNPDGKQTEWSTLWRRPDVPPPAFPGRTLTLQQRVDGDRWQTLATTTSGQDGMGYFRDLTAGDPGEVVYRVRQEDWFEDGHQIGWFPSFPTYVTVLSSAKAAAPSLAARSVAATPSATAPAPVLARSGTASITAAQRYGWRPALWDFAWEFGESLTSPPYRGSDLKGRWVDSSTGTGRTVHYNGGLIIDSQRQNDDRYDDSYGSTQAELRGNAAKYGRWEVRMRMKSTERTTRDYRALVELVPARKRHYRCGARNITVAEVSAHGSTVGVGVKTPRRSRQWTYTKRNVDLNNQSVAYAVEVGKRHISWFVEGRVIATIKKRRAVPGVPMTLRLSLVGDGDHEMNRTQAQFDWMRGYSLKRGKQVKRGHRLKGSKHHTSC